MNDDLISRKALKREFETLFYNDCGDFVRTERLIDDAPTVDERPKGKWIESQEEFEDAFIIFKHECSNCKQITFGGGNFCPNCGARMESDI